MAYNSLLPANDSFIADGPGEIRENQRALKDDAIVNAGTLNGVSSGNSSGNIPISNGTVCTNLNADKLDGNDSTAFAPASHVNSTNGHPVATTSLAGFQSALDKAKLDGIAAGAEVNQFSFSNILVGGVTVAADTKTDIFELVAGTNITISGNASTDQITINNSYTHPATHSADIITDGTTNKAYTAVEKTKLAGIETAADVTDGVNVGTSMYGATAKTTLADADTFPLTDSAASNVIKKITWSNKKTAILGILLTGLSTATSTAVAATDSILIGMGKLQAQINNMATTIRGTVLTGLSTATSTAVVATDTILVAIGKLQAQVTARLPLAGGQMTGALNEATGTAIASASTINLTTATGNIVHITGTTAITAVTLGSGMRRTVVFDGILTLTHRATNNNLPGAANITTAAGDRAIYTSDGTTVYCISYQRASGASVAGGGASIGTGNYIAEPFAVTPGTGLEVSVAANRCVIDETVCESTTATTVALTAKAAQLIYKKKDNTYDKLLPKMTAADLVDANTVGLWFPDGSASVANAAVGVNGNTLAVANNLTKSGTITAVDGWAGGYAAKGDGASGRYSPANFSGIPSGANVLEFNFLIKIGELGADQPILDYGSAAGNQRILFYVSAVGNLIINNNSSNFDTGYIFPANRVLLITLQYTGAMFKVYVNGAFGFSLSLSMGITQTFLYFLMQLNGVAYSKHELHFVEIRNALRTPAQIATLAQKLLIPCRYGSTDIRSVLPADSIVTSYIETSSTAPTKIVDASDPKGAMPDWAYGIRVRPMGSMNKRKFLGWKYSDWSVASRTLSWENPFGADELLLDYFYSSDSVGTDFVRVMGWNTNAYEVRSPSKRIAIFNHGSNGWASTTLGIGYKTTGYVGCYAEVID